MNEDDEINIEEHAEIENPSENFLDFLNDEIYDDSYVTLTEEHISDVITKPDGWSAFFSIELNPTTDTNETTGDEEWTENDEPKQQERETDKEELTEKDETNDDEELKETDETNDDEELKEKDDTNETNDDEEQESETDLPDIPFWLRDNNVSEEETKEQNSEDLDSTIEGTNKTHENQPKIDLGPTLRDRNTMKKPHRYDNSYEYLDDNDTTDELEDEDYDAEHKHKQKKTESERREQRKKEKNRKAKKKKERKKK